MHQGQRLNKFIATVVDCEENFFEEKRHFAKSEVVSKALSSFTVLGLNELCRLPDWLVSFNYS